MDEIRQLLEVQNATQSLFSTIFYFVTCITLSFGLRSAFLNFSNSLTPHNQLANLLPPLTGAVFLVIMIVKGSLALSLGLVGALSIVRFRTPIKEPEELMYLFVAIALGLGFGAGQALLTTVIIFLLIFTLFLSSHKSKSKVNANANISINWESNESNIEKLSKILSEHTLSHNVTKFSTSGNNHSAFISTRFKEDMNLDVLVSELSNQFNKAEVVILEDTINW